MSGQTPAKPKPQRATTSSKNRTTDSPPPFRSRNETSIEDFSQDFWQHALNVAEEHEDDFKHQALPLARIKKVAKMDPEVQGQMISSEVTVLFEKACQIFIQELTSRAHLVSLAARRRTLSRADVAQAVSRSDMFDFLIDIVPRTERAAASATATVSTSASASASTSANNAATSGSGSAKRPSRARKASQRDYDDLDDGEGVGGDGAGGRSNIVTPHPLMDMPEGVVFATGRGVGGGLPQLPPAAKRARYTVGDGSDAGGVDQGQVAMEQATSQQQEQEGGGEYYSLGGYGGEVGTGGRGGGAGAPGAEGEVGGAEQWTGGFDYATAAADPALAAFYQAQQLAAATQLQQQQQQQQEGAGEGGGEGCYQEGV